MYRQILLCMAACASVALGQPQNYQTPRSHETYQATGILQPESADLGENQRLVAATIDILPEITEVLQRVGNSRSTDPERVQQVMLDFLPLSRKVLKATADAEGKELNRKDIQDINAAEAVMPSVIEFMNKLREMDFFGTEQQQKTYQ
ncbi:uncharacterized protein LOC121868765 [Homarus americanus]|uniref:Uncharacterized protein n=1 Tax=Homarus americanus TaxID=6706 RepID=A0A8J5K3W0_HOMAM|nr:uncharacterized protein LOC121868764 [Homarus americanus]XP_042225585.1 uncharacterized protein LOC121868765 [Homarus americanus]KAG7167009.1 hypothetical protein Hamer_G005317 [Homarus americanus]